jgi:signal transduction histidine kinase
MAAIQRNASLQAKLIEDLLEMNKLTSGTVRLELALTDLGSAVHSALQALKPTADAKGVLLEVTVDPAVPLIQADERRVQQILWNLLHNAVKFTPGSGRVHVSVSRNGTSAQVLVKDTGQGIPADFLPFVFDRFRQADPSTTRGAWGLGIGLSIAKHLVELHGGSIEAASEGPGLGATFVVHLPISNPAATIQFDRSDVAVSTSEGTPGSINRGAQPRLAI